MAYHVITETPRLILRNFTENDADLIYDLNLNPEVTRYTYDPVKDLNHAQQILDTVILPQYALYNHGRWAVHLKPNLEFMGWCGLKFRPALNEIDLGYRLKREYWGSGYATEAAFASIKYGFEKLGLTVITGRAEEANAASCKVLEKCGMNYIGIQEIDGHQLRTYEIRNPFKS
jgi:ribosomal-protein-alanine N-acetyltransferase